MTCAPADYLYAIALGAGGTICLLVVIAFAGFWILSLIDNSAADVE